MTSVRLTKREVLLFWELCSSVVFWLFSTLSCPVSLINALWLPGVLIELGGLPIIYGLLESEDADARRDAMGLLFGLGYRKGMSLEEVLAKNEVQSFDPETMKVARQAMDAAFDTANYEYGKKVAMAEIDRKGIGVGVFAYGEAEVDSFAWVLHHAHPKPGEVFYDLGSGLGKAVIAAFLLHPFEKLVGIELLTDLAAAGDSLLTKYREIVHPSLPAGSAAGQRDPVTMELIEGDFLALDWSEADVVYANATRPLRRPFQPLLSSPPLLLGATVGAVA